MSDLTTNNNIDGAKKPKKIKGILIAIIFALIFVTAIIFILVLKPFKDKVSLEANQIKIGNDVYTFSAEKGIDNFSQIDSSDGEYISTYTFEVNDTEIGYSNLSLYNVTTYDGVSQKTKVAKAEELGWQYRNAFVPGGSYSQYYTKDGVLDWSSIEADYNKVISEGTLKNLDYYEALLDICEYEADEAIEADNIASLEEYGTKHYADSKKYIMSILAHGKLCHQLVNGEIDYFVLAFDMFTGRPAAIKIHIYGTADVVNARNFN